MGKPHIMNRAGRALLLSQEFFRPHKSYYDRLEKLFLQIFSAIGYATDLIAKHRKSPRAAADYCIPKIKEAFRYYDLEIPEDLYQKLFRYFAYLNIIVKEDSAETLTTKRLCTLLNILLPLLPIGFDLCFYIASKKSTVEKSERRSVLDFLHSLESIEILISSTGNLDHDLKKGNFNIMKFARDYKIEKQFFDYFVERNLKEANKIEFADRPEFKEELALVQKRAEGHLEDFEEDILQMR